MCCRAKRLFSQLVVRCFKIWISRPISFTNLRAPILWSIALLNESVFESIRFSKLPDGDGRQKSLYLHSSSSFDRFSDLKFKIRASSRRFLSSVVSRLLKMFSNEFRFRLGVLLRVFVKVLLRAFLRMPRLRSSTVLPAKLPSGLGEPALRYPLSDPSGSWLTSGLSLVASDLIAFGFTGFASSRLSLILFGLLAFKILMMISLEWIRIFS